MSANPSSQLKRLPYGHLLLLVAFFIAIGFFGSIPHSFHRNQELVDDLINATFVLSIYCCIGAIAGNFLASNSFPKGLSRFKTALVQFAAGFALTATPFVIISLLIDLILKDSNSPTYLKYTLHFKVALELPYAIFSGITAAFSSSDVSKTENRFFACIASASIMAFMYLLVLTLFLVHFISNDEYPHFQAFFMICFVPFTLLPVIMGYGYKLLDKAFARRQYLPYTATLFIVYTIAFGLGAGVLIKQGQINMFSAISVFGIGGILLIAVIHDINRRISAHRPAS
jgi:membrane-associated HD superfamily phosphohydrolase